MKTLFTEGEWSSHDFQVYNTETGQTVATVSKCSVKSEGEAAANAKLIAAAPELLGACLMAKEELIFGGDWKNAIKIIRKAISKATD